MGLLAHRLGAPPWTPAAGAVAAPGVAWLLSAASALEPGARWRSLVEAWQDAREGEHPAGIDRSTARRIRESPFPLVGVAGWQGSRRVRGHGGDGRFRLHSVRLEHDDPRRGHAVSVETTREPRRAWARAEHADQHQPEGAPAPMRGHPGAARLDQVFSTLTDPVDPAWVRGFTERLFAGPPPADFLDTQVAETLKVPARVIRATWAGIREFDISDQLRLIDVPTLIMWGDHDDLPVASRETQENLVHAIPDAELVVYAGVGHSPHWEQPVRFSADLTSFVHRVAARSGAS